MSVFDWIGLAGLAMVFGAIAGHVVKVVKSYRKPKPKPKPAGVVLWAIRDNQENGHIWLFVERPCFNPERTYGFDGTFVAMIPCHELATFPELQDLKYGDEPRRVRIEALK
jgi:hypothetical protein